MAKFRILDQGQESGKDEWYAQCLYGEHDTDVTVIISGQVLEYLKSIGSPVFLLWSKQRLPKQVVVFMDSPILQKMITRVQQHLKDEPPR